MAMAGHSLQGEIAMDSLESRTHHFHLQLSSCSSRAGYQGQFQGKQSTSTLIMSPEDIFVGWKNIPSSFLVAISQNTLQNTETDVTHISQVTI